MLLLTLLLSSSRIVHQVQAISVLGRHDSANEGHGRLEVPSVVICVDRSQLPQADRTCTCSTSPRPIQCSECPAAWGQGGVCESGFCFSHSELHCITTY
jgi:hypothetical protein